MLNVTMLIVHDATVEVRSKYPCTHFHRPAKTVEILADGDGRNGQRPSNHPPKVERRDIQTKQQGDEGGGLSTIRPRCHGKRSLLSMRSSLCCKL